MARSTLHYADNGTNNILKRLHNKLRPAGTPVQRVEYIIELLLLRIFEVKLKHDKTFTPIRKLFKGENYRLLFSHLLSLTGEQIRSELNKNFFPFYASILSKVRKVFPGNLPQKVQDQLVLIEEVFVDSSFSTNVQSGNMQEIIGLVQEIDEERILKTDLLGDAIESALSETGGTKDIGLYRTPNHIRQLIVAFVDPDFTDTIFDPACGTGGFLFDAYQYILEKTTKDGKWPTQECPPNHPELNEYFKKYFKKFQTKMPSVGIARNFYRSGIGGIEYLGMIRKMAAINLYIRGLNPQNIQQGDSLDIYDSNVDANSKTVVIANPPFGAKLDKPAYPNVWEEFPKTDSTALFVKLMFNLLQKGGRCAVVVSEGLLTWDNEAARNMRKILLEEANLRAIISLPQGVFISMGGIGAKTSILYFEKGSPTDWVWHYKIENDGFSMGINRRPIEGNQLPEVIEFFTNYVKQGKIPPETKNSFVIPAEWIKTLDPRIKDRIEEETEKESLEKSEEKRKKLIDQLKEKLIKGKIDKKEYKQKLWQFDNVLKNKIQNEITKRIEKAHSYSFNLQNYRSNLIKEQKQDWHFHTSSFVSFGGKGTKGSLEYKYKSLQEANPLNTVQILGTLDPDNALEMDIAKEYLSKVDTKSEKQIKENLWNNDSHTPKQKQALLICKILEDSISELNIKSITRQKYSKLFNLLDIFSNSELELDFKKHPRGPYDSNVRHKGGEFIATRQHQWLNIRGEKISKSMKFRNYEKEIELLNLNVYNKIVNYFLSNTDDELETVCTVLWVLNKNKKIDSAAQVKAYLKNDKNWKHKLLQDNFTEEKIGEAIKLIQEFKQGKNRKLEKLNEILKKGFQYPIVSLKELLICNGEKIKPQNYPETEFIILGVSNQKGVFVNEKKKGAEIKQSYFKVYKNQFCYNPYRVNVGSIGLNEFDFENQIISGAYNVFGVKEAEIELKYLMALLKTKRFLDYVNELASGGVRMDFKIEYLRDWQIPLPSIGIQREIVEKIERQKAIIKGTEKILGSWIISYDIFQDFDKKYFYEFIDLNPLKNIKKLSNNDLVSFVPMESIDDTEGKIKNLQEKKLKDVKKGYTYFIDGDVLFAKITPCMENGKVAMAKNLKNGIGFGTTELHIFRPKRDKVLSKYIYYFLRTKYFRELAKEKMTGASGHKRVPETFLKEFKYPVPPLEIQTQIVAKLDKEMEALEKVRFLKKQAEKRIERILEEVWGEI